MGREMESVIRQARGAEPVDVLLRGGTVVDVLTGRLRRAEVAIAGQRIAGVCGEVPEARRLIDCTGKFIAPGLIDGHIHLESSLLHPLEFARAAAAHGTTTVIADPHEIANVCGTEGARFMARAAGGGPVDVLLSVPSCVPASPLETSGAELGPREVAEMLAWPEAIGLGEMMDVPGVLAGQPHVLAKLAAAAGKPIDGHAPGLTGRDLQAYVAAGPDSDHECTTLAEAEEKLTAGMWIMIREGTAARNLPDLVPVVLDRAKAGRCLFVSDDLAPSELLVDGHLDRILRLAVAAGVDAIEALRLVTVNPAARFELCDRGAIRPGLLADIVVFDDLATFRVSCVLKRGVDVTELGQAPTEVAPPAAGCRIGALTPETFAVPAPAGEVRVIGVVPGQIVTEALTMALPSSGGRMVADPASDVAKIAVIERHGRGGGMGLGFVKGLGLQRGAVASTVAHDSHNLIVAGADDGSMVAAARAVAEAGGGFVAVMPGGDPHVLPLPIAGLMSDRPIAEVAGAVEVLLDVAATLGCRARNPFATLSFLALPVIPALKITDRGLVDVARFAHVPLAV